MLMTSAMNNYWHLRENLLGKVAVSKTADTCSGNFRNTKFHETMNWKASEETQTNEYLGLWSLILKFMELYLIYLLYERKI